MKVNNPLQTFFGSNVWFLTSPPPSPVLALLLGRELETNPYSWNMLANMLYVEQPVGVGFSYSDDIGDYKTGDEVTANDNYNFIQGWLDRFPQYRKNELYLSSESYGGHYIPTLTLNIIKRQKEADEKTINLGGFLVGNPYTDAESNAVAQYQRYWGENLISKPLYDSWMSKCVHGGYRPDLPECGELEELMDDAIGHLNPYALDYPTCTTSSPQGAWLRHHVSGKLSSAAPEYEPCAEDYTVTYLNNPEVLKALHVVDHFSAAGNQWAQCSDKVDYSRADVSSPVMAYYPAIVKASEKKLKILVYSGDDDAICATAGTQWWIWALGFEAQGSIWQPWHVDGQLAGFETRFDELTFITVHRSGHEVPAYTPVSALELFARYLDGRWFDPNPPVPGLDTL
jgi:carboxypeptidase C (cathepsin A)